MFAQQDSDLTAQESSEGILNSGAGRAGLNTLAGQQSDTLAGAVAPLYSEALGEYGQISGQEAGAQTGAYDQSLQDFYSAINSALGAAGAALGGGGGGGGGAGDLSAVAKSGGGSSGPGETNPYA